jgi:hypothetical protein
MKYIVLLLLAVAALASRPSHSGPRAPSGPPALTALSAPAADSRTDVSFKGSRQGQFKGQNSKGGRESDGWFVVNSFSFPVETPRVVTIRKQTDAASPKLLEALNTSETLEVVIQTMGPNDRVIKNVTLKNAIVKGIHKDDWETVTLLYTVARGL